jgi:hypothetical protein
MKLEAIHDKNKLHATATINDLKRVKKRKMMARLAGTALVLLAATAAILCLL